ALAALSTLSRADELTLHVNQVVLERAGPKSAIVEYTGESKDGRFTVYENNAEVLTGGLVEQPKFEAWGTGRRYFNADFSALARSGRYRLEANFGDLEAVSPDFVVADRALFTVAAESLVNYFRLSRHVKAADHHIRVWGSKEYVDVWGGWKDAGGDNGKYLTHLSYANFFNPQQTGFAAWALARAYEFAPQEFRRQGIERPVIEEALWGADFLHRLLSRDGYFYMTVFDRWAEPGAERVLTAYSGIHGEYSTSYQAAFREGAGSAIAALARAARLSRESGIGGVFTADQYLADAERAFDHLQENNLRYVDDGKENIIDDYTALLAATELYKSTSKPAYLDAARKRAESLTGRLTPDGWWRSDDGARPFYHGADAGFPVLSLSEYLAIEKDAARKQKVTSVIERALDAQIELDAGVANPFDYARQSFQLYRDGKRDSTTQTGFFMPHANETGYWWQGETARLASLATAAVIGGRAVHEQSGAAFGVDAKLAAFAQHQIDWTLGRNPFDICMLYGFGARNPPHSWSAGDHVRGGLSNGITGADGNDDGSGIQFGASDDSENWRWYEQWIPHAAWFLLATASQAQIP
ncbi:MAG: glycoside hydrolase family 9 protein, partial [Steroidobacteraceae bacterium]